MLALVKEKRKIVKIGYDYAIWLLYRMKMALMIELCSLPSLLLTGSSGSGKSYALKYLLDKLLACGVTLYFCNFKRSDDFRFLEGYERYFTYTACIDGLQQFYDTFKERQNSGVEFAGTFHILVFDEFPAFILSETLKDKKAAERYKTMVSEVLMLGRSYGFGIWLVMQRPDSSFLSNGARDNFHSTITLGNMSKEAKSMLYSGEELPERVYKAGEGVCWIDGIGIKEIKFPKIRDMPSLEARISSRLRPRP